MTDILSSTISLMLFCPFCSNILVIEKQSSGNGLSCKACTYVYIVVDDMIKTMHMTPKRSESLIDEDKELKLAATCEKRCSSCGFEETMFIEMQTRSADEPMTVLYVEIHGRNRYDIFINIKRVGYRIYLDVFC